MSDEGPVDEIVGRARDLVLHAMQKGWSGPPFDPFQLAEMLRIRVVASEQVLDARIGPVSSGRYEIEFNPDRGRGRVRFSVAHELAHTLFPDCGERLRERQAGEQRRADDWQLEMLCNIGASEILMPIGSFPELEEESLNIDSLMDLRRRYDVSTEALLLRTVKLTADPCLAFCCSRRGRTDRYQIDYTATSRATPRLQLGGRLLPKGSAVDECTAIGYTAKADEQWPGVGLVHVECVGIPPYPGHAYPRVAGIATAPEAERAPANRILYLQGDATDPRGEGTRILAFIVNDKGLSWGAGFALEVQKKWRDVQRDFRRWAVQNPAAFCVGNARKFEIEPALVSFAMIAQKGYGRSTRPRIRYEALEDCLRQLSKDALSLGASVHMPRIGSGQAGGSWPIIAELIETFVCDAGVSVTVYNLPGRKHRRSPEQLSLFTRHR